jgi:two-component system, NarL family, nitrate/nitrite response regulator NarL
VAEDPLVREALAASLSKESSVRVVERAEDAHVALLDPGAPSQEGDRASRARLDAGLAPVVELDIPSVVLAEGESQARAALARGARGAVMRKPDGPRLVAALGAVAAGLTVLDFALGPPAPAADDVPPPQLTAREQEVLELLAGGFSNRRIARRLGISEHTAKFHVNGILVKLSAGTRTEAVVIAARRGLVML